MRFVVVLLVMLMPMGVAHAQYSVDWSKGTAPDPLDKEVAPGGVRLIVNGINDFLYQYQINVVEMNTATPGPGATALMAPPRVETTGCDELKNAQKDLDDAYDALQKLYPPAGSAGSIPIRQSQDDWNASVKRPGNDFNDAMTATHPGDCAARAEEIRKNNSRKIGELEAARTKLFTGSHSITTEIPTHLCKTEKIHIAELYQGTPTSKSIDTSIVVECDQFTVGGGVLMTEIQTRSYASRSSPGQAGQFLSVESTGKMRPAFLLGLTTFNFPWPVISPRFSSNLGEMRLGISTGPVVQANGKSQVSSFGWFLGASLSFYRRLYITPGLHWGEFADIPFGFTPEQQIPANFGELTPRKRWTCRFALGITIKGWDVSKLIKGGEEQPTPPRP